MWRIFRMHQINARNNRHFQQQSVPKQIRSIFTFFVYVFFVSIAFVFLQQYRVIIGAVFIALPILGFLSIVLFARMKQNKFNKKYDELKKPFNILVINKSVKNVSKQKGFLNLKLKAYQVDAKIDVAPLSRMKSITLITEQKVFDQLKVGCAYTGFIAGNYLGEVKNEIEL